MGIQEICQYPYRIWDIGGNNACILSETQYTYLT